MSKALVVYFSRTGEQYGVGNIKKGNTEILAEIIAANTGADIFKIKVADDKYPNTYNELVQYAKKEKERAARPEIVGRVDNIDDYDTVFLGYPNWWGDMPMPVYSFLDAHDLSGKTVYHICTHEGSGGVVRNGFALQGHIIQNNPDEVKKRVTEWLKQIGY